MMMMDSGDASAGGAVVSVCSGGRRDAMDVQSESVAVREIPNWAKWVLLVIDDCRNEKKNREFDCCEL